MTKKLILLLYFTSNISILFGALQPAHWLSIVEDIARDGDENSKGEFEAAKQAFLNIKLQSDAQKGATAINNKWVKSSNNDIKNEAAVNALMSLPRYPTMDTNTVKVETRKLLRKPDINQLIIESGVTIDVPNP